MRAVLDPGAFSSRIAMRRDAPRLVSLIRSAYRGDASRAGWTSEADLLEGDRTDLASVLGMLGDQASRMLVVEKHGELVACCQIESNELGVAQLGTFAVAPRLQARGLGGWLLDQAERAATTTFHADTVQISVVAQQAALLAWYERRGFVRTGETRPFPADARYARPLRDDLHFVILRKPIGIAP